MIQIRAHYKHERNIQAIAGRLRHDLLRSGLALQPSKIDMRIFNLFRPHGRIAGRIVVSGLPAHHQFSVSAAILEVGNIPRFVGEYRDVVRVKEFEDPADKPLEFNVRRRVFEYFIAVNLMVMFQRGKKLEIQTE